MRDATVRRLFFGFIMAFVILVGIMIFIATLQKYGW